MTDAQEIWKIGREAYEYIKNIPEITRADLNINLHTSSNNRRNEFLTEALRCMLTLGQIKKFMDTEGHCVYYWVSSFNSRYLADRIARPHSDPIDCLGPQPGSALPPAPAPAPAPATAVDPIKTFVNTEFKSPDQKKMEKMHEELNGILKDIYAIMMTDPTKLYRTSDTCFAHLHENDLVRAQSVGRLAKMGAVKKYGKDVTGDRVFTINGTAPDGYVEMEFKPTKNALKKQQAAEAAADRQRIILNTQQQMQEKVEQEQHQGGEDKREQGEPTTDDKPDVEDTVGEDTVSDEVEEDKQAYEPVMHFTSDQTFMLLREDGSQLDFTDAESAAMRRLIKMINVEKLRD